MYLLFEVIDKWEDADTISDHDQRVPLLHALPTVQKIGRSITVLQNQ